MMNECELTIEYALQLQKIGYAVTVEDNQVYLHKQ
jgi:hypothetical protein